MKTITEINEKELAVIREISNNNLPDQRTISKNTGISLGLTNLIIKRLIKKGYIKILQLNKRKIQYILTPKGFTEKAKKSYNYTIKTINLLKLMKEKIKELIIQLYNEGNREFVIIGNNELASIIELSFKEINLSDLKYNKSYNKNNLIKKNSKNIIFLTDTNSKIFKYKNSSDNVYDIISYLSNSGIYT